MAALTPPAAHEEGSLIRRCPSCGTEQPPATLRCPCGALLAGVDLTRPAAAAPPPAADPPRPADAAPAVPDDGPVCPWDDCGEPNPPGATQCVYCNRPLAAGAVPATPAAPTLFALPGPLAARYRIVHALPAAGAEAELLVVAPLAGGEEAIAKIYRHGIRPRPEVAERLATVDPAHRVDIREQGLADGFVYELMEYCRAGSLRDLLRDGPLPPEQLATVVDELAAALRAVHAARLIHRDLKPENILVRRRAPLDLVLTDFGIASPRDATVRFTGLARTLAYGAPEAISGVLDEKADWWSLGMILLEAATGTHPFAGLSDAVILHRLTTRAVDGAAVADTRCRQLIGGLLLRDPKARWGADEVARWQAGDRTLPPPAEPAFQLDGRAPYRIGGESCHTPGELAVALARHWRQATADLDNGQLLAWFRDTLRDQDLTRLLIEINLERRTHADVRLVRLLTHLAPGMPPVWRGEPAARAAVLAAAGRALKGDGDAAAWLDTLHAQRVLEHYAAAGNAEAADLITRWHGALDAFDAAWREACARLRALPPPADAVVRFDDVVFGRHAGPPRPPNATLHARLLALAYDRDWSARLRARLAEAVAAHAAGAPWLLSIGDVASLPPAALLVVHALLPEARRHAERQAAHAAQAAAEAAETARRLQGEALVALGELARATRFTLPSADACATLRAALDAYWSLTARVRASGASDAAHQKLRARLARAEPVALRIGQRLDALEPRLAANRGWLSQESLAFAGVAVFVLPIVLGDGYLPLLLVALAGVAAWRLLPPWHLGREIRALGRRLEAA